MHDAVESFQFVGMQFAYTLSLECYLDTYYATSLNAQTGDGFLILQQALYGFVVDVFQGV